MSIYRCHQWDEGIEQQFIGVSPVWDEVLLYQTKHPDSVTETNDISKVAHRLGFDHILCFDYSRENNGIVGVGCNGENTVAVFDIKSESSSVLKIQGKQLRPINSISFCDNLLAIGFDKGRLDNSLQIWNIEHYSRTSNNDHISAPLQGCLLLENVTSVTWVDPQNLLVASPKHIRGVDTRASDPHPTWQVNLKLGFGVTCDPFDSHYFGSYSEDGTVAIWDQRKILNYTGLKKSVEPLLTFPRLVPEWNPRKNQGPCLRFSLVRRGEFATVYSGDTIRRWNYMHVPPVPPHAPDAHDAEKLTSDTPELTNLKNQCLQVFKPSEELLIVSIVLDVKTDYERVVSFDYSPDLTCATSTNFVCMRQSGLVFRMPAVECVEEFNFNPYNELSYCGPEGTHTLFLPPSDSMPSKSRRGINHAERRIDLALNDDLKKYTNLTDGANGDEDEESFDDYDEEFEESDDDLDNARSLKRHEATALNLDPQLVMYNDICNVIRRRALMGYGLQDCANNIKILENIDVIDGQMLIRNVWKWIDLAKKSLDKGAMISQGVDLGFQGVLGIWNGPSFMQDEVRTSRESGPLTMQMFKNAVQLIVNLKGTKTASILIPKNSQKKAERMLCLIVSGWYLANLEFEEKLDILVNLGFTTKAAGWAVFHGDVNKAIEILSRAKNERLRIIATAIAGYLAYSNSKVNLPWKDQCRRMALELDDPYLRAIFAYIADNDWWDVLDEHLLPLRERLGVALSFLSDKDLDVYLNRVADTVIKRGELEGLILTGVTPTGINLLQSYVDRTKDVQTAALISAFACPRYFISERVKHWMDSYRTLLNSWQLFLVRAKLDVLRTKLSKNYSGHPTLKANPKQVHLQCLRCNKNFNKPVGQLAAGSANGNLSGLSGAGASLIKQFNKLQMKSLESPTIANCVHCGAPFPRCSVCLLTLGTPIPDQPIEANKNAAKFNDWFSFCLLCNHGCHAHHAEEWFRKHYVCPVPLCNCRCNSK